MNFGSHVQGGFEIVGYPPNPSDSTRMLIHIYISEIFTFAWLVAIAGQSLSSMTGPTISARIRRQTYDDSLISLRRNYTANIPFSRSHASNVMLLREANHRTRYDFPR
jgi:hypothetical protein